MGTRIQNNVVKVDNIKGIKYDERGLVPAIARTKTPVRC
jgi:hypothetical protein